MKRATYILTIATMAALARVDAAAPAEPVRSFDLLSVGTPAGLVTRIHGSAGIGDKGVPRSSPLGRDGAGEGPLVIEGAQGAAGDGRMAVNFIATNGVTYFMQQSVDLSPHAWSNIVVGIDGIDGMVTVTNPVTGEMETYYRVGVE
jgi:hypothetical protein